jgi:translation initiation factor eIF-2B subunit beta
VLANGGLVSLSGSHLVASAANYHHIPVVVTTGLYKLSPLQPSDEDSFRLLMKPDPLLKFEEGLLVSD